eukprot:3596500-Amphidinium_carterae.1
MAARTATRNSWRLHHINDLLTTANNIYHLQDPNALGLHLEQHTNNDVFKNILNFAIRAQSVHV